MSKKTATKPGTELTVKNATALAVQAANVPSFLAGYKGVTGTEGIEAADVTIPRVKIGQSMSDEVKSGDLKEGTLFLNVGAEVLAEPGKPLNVVLVARAKEYILWRPRKDNNGGILARARPVKTPDGVRYAWDKPNTSFEVKVEGKTKVTWKTGVYVDDNDIAEWGSEIPGDKESGIAATLHYNFVVMLPDFDNMLAALSMSRTAVGPAKDWNEMLKRKSNVPIFARKFAVVSVDDNRGDDKFKNFKVTPEGFVDEADFNAVYKPAGLAFADKYINVDHSDGEEASSDERL